MASFLGIKRSLYAMIESGQRSLSGPAALRINTLYEILSEEPTSPSETSENNKTEELEALLLKYKNELIRRENENRKNQSLQSREEKIRRVLAQFDRFADPALHLETDQHWKELLQLGLSKPANPSHQAPSDFEKQLEKEALLFKISQIEEEKRRLK